MAFQILKVTARVSESLTRIRLNQLIQGYKSSRCGLHSTALTAPPNARRAINIASISERFLTTSFSRSGGIKPVGLFKAELSRYRSIAVLFGTVVVSAATVCCTSVCAMSTKPTADLESEKSNWKEVKNQLLSMSLQDRRARYKTDYISLDKVSVWKPSGSVSAKPLYKANEDLNQKISVFRGDITKLEIDAIANAANKTLLGGGGVDGAIHRGAGPHLRKECSTLGGCETGEAKITGAYNLPAKYVIHTVGPIAHGSVGERERRALRDCYYNCLRTATENKLRTVAFPCISTGVYGYPPEQAVEVALKTVREYLEEHHGQVDRVIFCVFLKSDEDLYMSRLPAYFPKAC